MVTLCRAGISHRACVIVRALERTIDEISIEPTRWAAFAEIAVDASDVLPKSYQGAFEISLESSNASNHKVLDGGHDRGATFQ